MIIHLIDTQRAIDFRVAQCMIELSVRCKTIIAISVYSHVSLHSALLMGL